MKIPEACCKSCKFNSSEYRCKKHNWCFNICEDFKIKFKYKILFFPLLVVRFIFSKLTKAYFKDCGPRIYMAGPYSANNVMDVFENMKIGLIESAKVLKENMSPFSPWLDYQFILSSQCSEKFKISDFYNYSIAYLITCDAMFIVQGNYLRSKGTLKEIVIAQLLGIPIYKDLGLLFNDFLT